MWRRRREPEPSPVVQAAEQTARDVSARLDELTATYQQAQELMDVLDNKFPAPPSNPGQA